MNNDKFTEVIEFAIACEREAADFYRDMQSKVRFESSVRLLSDLEQMELNHIMILRGFTSEGLNEYVPPKIADLKIVDAMVEKEASPDMTFQDIIVHAMKREEKANKLYGELAEKTGDTATKNMFLRLASEEAGHKLMLETLYDQEILMEN